MDAEEKAVISLHDTIARLRRLHPNNPDIMRVCRELESRIEDKPRGTPEKPARALYAKDQKGYYRAYMRWWRQNGQVGNGREEGF